MEMFLNFTFKVRVAGNNIPFHSILEFDNQGLRVKTQIAVYFHLKVKNQLMLTSMLKVILIDEIKLKRGDTINSICYKSILHHLHIINVHCNRAIHSINKKANEYICLE